ncbi:MAG: AAC(3) family N-acetyltransferase [Candidatus Latescibacterota bacterium]|nr:AAC(3) family N-acetyltransferase [Candidatus Latescibacterota bacterium]
MIKRILRGLLPAAVYGAGRGGLQYYRQQRQTLAPRLGEDACRRLLADELGLARGDIAFVHSSVDRLNLDFPFFKLLGLLRQAVGAEGTLLFPASQLVERPETWLARGEVFDLRRSPTAMGLLPELSRRQRGAARSLHPTHSVVALGPKAGELVAEHHCAPEPCGARSPYYKVAERGGIVVGLGVDADILTMVHCVDDILGAGFPVATCRSGLYQARVVDEAECQREVETLVRHPRIRFRRMLRFLDAHIDEGICRRFRLGGAPFYRVDAGALYGRMRALAERGVTIYWRGIHRTSRFEPLLSQVAERLETR